MCDAFFLRIHAGVVCSEKTSIRANIKGVTKLEKSIASLIFTVYSNYCTPKYIAMV